MKIYLATWLLEKSQGESLSEIGKDSRLISYYHTKEVAEQLTDYVEESNERNTDR